jgi:hypothetical protein
MRSLPEGSRVVCMGGTVRLMTQREYGRGGCPVQDSDSLFLPSCAVFHPLDTLICATLVPNTEILYVRSPLRIADLCIV